MFLLCSCNTALVNWDSVPPPEKWSKMFQTTLVSCFWHYFRVHVQGTLAACWSSRRAAGSCPDRPTNYPVGSNRVRDPRVLRQGLEKTGYTSITRAQKAAQQLVYIPETGHGIKHWRGKKGKMRRWKKRNGEKARGHVSDCWSTDYSYKLAEVLVYVGCSCSWRDPFQKHLCLCSQNRAIASNSCQPCTTRSGQFYRSEVRLLAQCNSG